MAVETMNKIVVNFSTCNPVPGSGYNIVWRVAGSLDPYTDAGNFFITPAVFYDDINPPDTCYEGFIKSDCNSIFGNPVAWMSCESGESGFSAYDIALVGECLPAGIESSYLISGGTAGDIVTVRATFSGILQKTGAIFTKACLAIAAPDGVSDPQVCSDCYTDTAIHGFNITADTVITMTGPLAQVLLSAVIHNGSESPTGVFVTIIDINGTPVNISVSGCKGNSGTGGTC